MSKKRKSKSKVTRKDIAWWTYFVIMIALVIFGFWNSEGAEALLRAPDFITFLRQHIAENENQ